MPSTRKRSYEGKPSTTLSIHEAITNRTDESPVRKTRRTSRAPHGRPELAGPRDEAANAQAVNEVDEDEDDVGAVRSQ